FHPFELCVHCLILSQVVDQSLHVSSSNCCYTFMEKRISLQRIQCYRNTSSTCPYQKSLILKLIGGLQTCVLQTKPWVRAYFKRIKPCPS
uniref:C-C motif chemokine n=1 Tax=Sus scrofa TaxID=9823 RepID=A0A8D1W2C8_PIG